MPNFSPPDKAAQWEGGRESSEPNDAYIRLNKTWFFRKVGVKAGPSGDPFLGLALGTRLRPCAKTMKHTSSGAFLPLAAGVGCCQQDRPGCPRGHSVASP